MNKDYNNVVKQWPASYVWYTNNNGLCEINSANSGIVNFSQVETLDSNILLNENLIKKCTYPIDSVTAIDQVDNFGIIYGNEDPDKVLLLYGFCKNNPSHERCVGIEQTLCSTFPYHPNCIMNVQTKSWSWVYTVLIMFLAVGLGYMMSSPSNKTSSNY